MSNRKITIGILAHVDAGKTTLSEAILYLAGEIRKPGRVDHGDAFLDDNIIERNRGITIFSRQARFTVAKGSDNETEVTLIDTPGHVDFTAETERSLSVLDCALLVISGSEGIQAHTRTLYRMLQEHGIPVFIFINKMDIAVRDIDTLIAELNSELVINAVDFSDAAERTEKFIDDVTLYSPVLAEAVLGGDGSLSDEDIACAISKGEIVPCVAGSALKMEGVRELIDVIARYAREPEYGSDFGAKIYKVTESEDGERLCFIKITGGELRVRDRVTVRSEASGEREEKVSRIRLYSGSRFEQTDIAASGTVCAVTGLGQALPGDSLGAETPVVRYTVDPYMVYKVLPPEGMDPHKLKADLDILTAEDPVLQTRWSADDSIEMRLMGQVQLEVLQSVIKERFGYDAGFDAGSVLYLETITGKYEGVGHFEPLRHYAEVHLILEPGERGSGIVITSDVPEDELAVNWQRLIMTHIEEKEHLGTLTGSPLTDTKITLAAGRAHAKHTEGGDFREATYRAIRNALMQAARDGNVALLEPWSEYEIDVPAGSVGRVMTDIKQMGGTQESLEQRGDRAVVKGRVPSAEITNYPQTLAGFTSGEGRLSLTQSGYDICHNTEEVIAERGYDAERDVENTADSVFVNHSGSDIVSWDEVPEHMHIKSVLRSRPEEGDAAEAQDADRLSGPDADPYDKLDVRERARRRAAAEKDLRAIFERTYGAQKNHRHKDRSESRYGAKARAAADDKKAMENAARNAEIKARHEHKSSEQTDEVETLILIDGYNLIFSDEYMRSLADEDIGSARDHLIERLKNYAGYTGFEVNVIFDAYKVVPGEGSNEDHQGIKVIYTAADEPADIRIGIMINTIKGKRIYAVSSDNLVEQDAWSHGALRISSREFIHLLDETDEEIRAKLRKYSI